MKHVGKILTLCKGILWMISEVKANKKRCRRLADRVRALKQLVESIQQGGLNRISPNVNSALWNLCTTLTTAQELVRKCTKTKFLNLFKCKSEFNSVNESLNDTFHILCGALQVEQGSMMRRMFQDYNMEEDDDDDWALVPYSGAMAPVCYSAAAAPMPYFAPRPQPTTAVYTAVMGME
eukprot:superscaffoldBa00011994_g25469